MRKISFTALFLFLLFPAPHVMALSFDLMGEKYLYLGAHIDFFYTSSTDSEGVIDITIKNTSSDPYGILTAFTFNSPDVVTGVTNFTAKDQNSLTLKTWNFCFDPDQINTLGPYGRFDVAGLTGPNFNGGKPNYGIDEGSTFSFTFAITGNGLNLLNESSFLGEYSDPQNQNSDIQYFLARYQRVGYDGEYSDVAVPVNPVPEPATMILLGTGLVGLAGATRKKFKK